MMSRVQVAALLLTMATALVLSAPRALAEDREEFRPLFDGETLDGWKARDMDFWSVENGVIRAASTEDHRPPSNSFLVWQGGEVEDFVLRLEFRLSGSDTANSGIQFRSSVQDDGHLVGYQADMDRSTRYVGAIYDEHRRGMLAERGQRVVVDEAGERQVEQAADPADLLEHVDLSTWNEYEIKAVGPRLTIRINGELMAEVHDHDEQDSDRRGVLALQLHAGSVPTTVEFRNIRLRTIDDTP